ncbi:MAG TPA: EpsI family protein [Chthoniobacter sp.]|nr:EpsI family protein [Chthoniobacter sp.]
MTTKRLAVLLAVFVAGFGSIFLLPHQLGYQPAGVDATLPKMVGGWYGQDLDITQKELDVLGKDVGTEFARKSYHNGQLFEIVASVVLSGDDMSRSIHRPERCLPAQGFTVIDNRTVPIALPDHGTFKVTRLQNVRSGQLEDGSSRALYNLTYYWFIGHTQTTSSHLVRIWLDMRDRLVHGYNQRWAYVTVSAQIPPGAEEDPKTQKVIDDWMKDFIKQLAPKIQKDSVRIASAN